MTAKRGSSPFRMLATVTRVSATIFETRSLIGISSSRIAGEMRGGCPGSANRRSVESWCSISLP